jgi:hypothetical protein
VIELGLCLDLTTSSGLDWVRIAYQSLVDVTHAADWICHPTAGTNSGETSTAPSFGDCTPFSKRRIYQRSTRSRASSRRVNQRIRARDFEKRLIFRLWFGTLDASRASFAFLKTSSTDSLAPNPNPWERITASSHDCPAKGSSRPLRLHHAPLGKHPRPIPAQPKTAGNRALSQSQSQQLQIYLSPKAKTAYSTLPKPPPGIPRSRERQLR